MALEIIKDIENHLAGCGIEVSGGLVRQDEQRIIDECSRDGRSLLLPAGKFVGAMMTAVGQTDLGNDMFCSLTPFTMMNALIEQGHLQVFKQGELCDQIEVLEDKAYFFAAYFREGVVVEFRHISTVKEILP